MILQLQPATKAKKHLRRFLLVADLRPNLCLQVPACLLVRLESNLVDPCLCAPCLSCLKRAKNAISGKESKTVLLLTDCDRWIFFVRDFLIRRILQDECGQLVTRIDRTDVAAGFATLRDLLAFHSLKRATILLRPVYLLPKHETYQNGFWILAFGTEDELLDETVQQLLQLCRVVLAIHDETFVLEIELRLRSEFATEILGRV